MQLVTDFYMHYGGRRQICSFDPPHSDNHELMGARFRGLSALIS